MTNNARWTTFSQAHILTLTALLLASIVSVIFQGFEYGVNNNALQIPLLNKAQQPGLYPNDPYVDTLGDYTSIVWLGLSQLSFVSDWPTLFLALHVATRLLILTGFFTVLRALQVSHGTALFGTTVLAITHALMGYTYVGGSDLLIPYFNHSEISLALVLIASSFLLRNKFYAGTVLAAIAFNINAFFGLWAAATIAALKFQTHNWNITGRLIQEGIRLSVIFLLISSPTLFWIIKSQIINDNAPEGFNYVDFINVYASKHFLITASDAQDILLLATATLAGLLAILSLQRQHRAALLNLYICFIVLFAVGAVLPFISQHRTLLNLHLMRTDTFLIIFSALAIMATSLVRATHTQRDEHLGSSSSIHLIAIIGLCMANWLVILGALLTAQRTLDRPALKSPHAAGALLFAMAAMALAVGFKFETNYPIELSLLWLAITGFVFLFGKSMPARNFGILGVASIFQAPYLVAASLVSLLPYIYANRFSSTIRAGLDATVVAAGLYTVTYGMDDALSRAITASALILFAMGYVKGLGRLPLSASPKVIAMVCIALVVTPTVGYKLANRYINGSLGILNKDQLAWRAVQQWAQSNTHTTDVFVVPLEFSLEGFAAFSERSVWVDRKQGGAVMWAPPYFKTWQDRMAEQRKATDLREFSGKNNISYVVARKNLPFSAFNNIDLSAQGLSVVYKNSRFIVYKI